MNTPNKLTMLRIFLVPFFIAALLINDLPHNYLIAMLIFIAASITDLLDGKIARKNNLITDFGKFADPLADKILVISAFVCFVELGIMGSVPLIILVFREFAVTSIRLVAAGNKEVVAANNWGKLKTVSQIVAIIAVLFFRYILQLMCMAGACESSELYKTVEAWLVFTYDIFIWSSVILAVISGVIYLKANIRFIKSW